MRLVRDVEARDRYARLLAYVYRKRDGLFVNLALAPDGFAAPLSIPPNVAHTADFTSAAARRGTPAAASGADAAAPTPRVAGPVQSVLARPGASGTGRARANGRASPGRRLGGVVRR